MRRGNLPQRTRRLRPLEPARLEMGVEEKMAPEDQHGGYSHPPSHSTSSDLGACLHTSWSDSMAILMGVGPREQVLVSTSLSTSLHFPPRSGCLAVLVDRAVLWPQVADDPAYSLGHQPPVVREQPCQLKQQNS